MADSSKELTRNVPEGDQRPVALRHVLDETCHNGGSHERRQDHGADPGVGLWWPDEPSSADVAGGPLCTVDGADVGASELVAPAAS